MMYADLMFILRYWLPVVLYAGLITYLSSLSSTGVEVPSFFFGLEDKVIHAIEYGIFGILWYRAYDAAAGRTVASYATILAILSASLFGMTDEIHQYFVPLRHADVWDLVADTIGAIVGVRLWQTYSVSHRSIRA